MAAICRSWGRPCKAIAGNGTFNHGWDGMDTDWKLQAPRVRRRWELSIFVHETIERNLYAGDKSRHDGSRHRQLSCCVVDRSMGMPQAFFRESESIYHQGFVSNNGCLIGNQDCFVVLGFFNLPR